MSLRFTLSSPLYEIQEILGESSFSTVYLAERSDKSLKIRQPLVIKLFKEKKSPLPHLQMESLLRARHCSHLIKVLSFEKFESRPALILEYISGINLKELLEKSALNSNEADCICSQVLTGLEELKNIGLAQGDLSLSNILIDRTGQIYLTDYGLGNYEKNFYGTEPFPAPEIYKGKKPDFFSDLFSLGVLEKRLKGSFTNKEFSALKGEDFICPKDPLLDPRPQNRKKRDFAFSPKGRRTLGEKVNQILIIKKCFPTKRPQPSSQKSFPARGIFLGGMTFFILFTANPFVSYGNYKVLQPPAEVLIRSHQWMHIQMAGVKGYTPINIPISQAGTYKIQWKKNNSRGEKHLYIKPGQKAVLRDDDFP